MRPTPIRSASPPVFRVASLPTEPGRASSRPPKHVPPGGPAGPPGLFPRRLQPEIPPHLTVFEIEDHDSPAVVGEGDVLGGEAEGHLGGAPEGDLGADGGGGEVDEVEAGPVRGV